MGKGFAGFVLQVDMETLLAANDTRAPVRLIRLPEVMNLTGLGRSTIYELMAQGEFPKPVPLGRTSGVAWVESEILQWIWAQIRARK